MVGSLALGVTRELRAQATADRVLQLRALEHAPFPASQRGPGRVAPDAIVSYPSSFDASAPFRVVTYLHGYAGCTEVLVATGPARCTPRTSAQEGYGLVAAHASAPTPSVLVVPQLAWSTRSGSPGRFAERGRFALFLDEVLDRLASELGAPLARRATAPLLLTAHSAGFEPLLPVLARGGRDPETVVLFDALYGGLAPFADWCRAHPEASFVSYATASDVTARRQAQLARSLRDLGARVDVRDDDGAPTRGRISFRLAAVGHRRVPSRYLPDVLRM